MTTYNFEPDYTGSKAEQMDAQFTREGVERPSTATKLSEALWAFVGVIDPMKLDSIERDAIWRIVEVAEHFFRNQNLRDEDKFTEYVESCLKIVNMYKSAICKRS